jgi:hypothetical protein
MSVGSDVGVGLAAVVAIGAALSTRAVAARVALRNRPYVYAEATSIEDRVVGLTFHNDGPGPALEVRARTGAPGVDPTPWSDPIRAFTPDQRPLPAFTVGLPEGVMGLTDPFYVETEYSDIRGARWLLRNERGGKATEAMKPIRVRRGWLDVWRPRS